MGDESLGQKADHELAHNLDALFGDDTNDTRHGAEEIGDPLDELKSIVMSIEWEITDELMERLIAQVEELKICYGEDRILVMFLQLLGSLGLYIKTNKGSAHPTAFSLLSSVYANFANAVGSEKLSVSEKKKLLYGELNKYKELKEQLGITRRPPKALSVTPTRPQEAYEREGNDGNTSDPNVAIPNRSALNGDTAGLTPQQLDAVEARIKNLICDEFKKLREALVQEGGR